MSGLLSLEKKSKHNLLNDNIYHYPKPTWTTAVHNILLLVFFLHVYVYVCERVCVYMNVCILDISLSI